MSRKLIEKLKPLLNKAGAFVKTYYQYIISAALIILLVLIVYGTDLAILVNESLQNEALSHVLLMPFFVGILFYLKKDIVKASLALEENRKKAREKYIDEIVGVILCLIAFLVYWYGSYTFYPLEYHLFSLPIFVMGVTLVLFNVRTLIALIFPVLFLLFLIPFPSEYMYAIGGTMANFNTQASYNILKTFGLPVTMSSELGPPVITLTSAAGRPANFTIDLPCSGIYSLIAFAMFAAFLALIALAPISKKALVFIIGFFMFEIMNIIRITTIISIAYWFGQEIAMQLFHTVAGLLLIFIGMLFTLFIADRFLKIQILPTQQTQPTCPECETSSKTHEDFCPKCGKLLDKFRTKISQRFWTKLFLLILGCYIVTFSIHAPTFAIVQGPVGVTSNAGWENATSIFPQIPDYQLRYLYRDTSYEIVSHQDASLWYAYYPEPNKKLSTAYIDVGVASSISNLHNWEVCLITWQTAQGRYPLVSVIDSRDIQLLEDVPIIARYLVFKNTNPPANYTQVTLYWYESAAFKSGITVEQKYVRISLIVLTQNSTRYKQLEDELLPVAKAVASYWEPLKNQSLISLGVPAQQLLLAFSIGFVALTKTAQYSNDWRKRTNNRHIFNRFATAKEKIMYQTVQELAKERKHIETKDISEALKIKIGKSVKSEKLLAILNHLEEFGFVKKDVVSVQNQPKLVWKIQ